MILLLVSTFFVLLITYWYLSKPKFLPPGPSGVPLLGYLPWLIWNSKRRGEHFMELREKYGDVICVRLGFYCMIILNSYDAIKEALVKHGDAFSGRGLHVFRNVITHGKGMISAEGPRQREQRRFLLRVLRDFGFGKIAIESHILDEVEDFCKLIDDYNQSHVDTQTAYHINDRLTQSIANNITAIVFGRRLDRDEITLLVTQLKNAAKIPASFIFYNAMPKLHFLSWLPGFTRLVGQDAALDLRVPLESFALAQTKEHHKQFDENVLSDVVHTYIAEQKKQSDPDDVYWWDDEQIKHITTELLIAGTQTTKDTLVWGLCFMCVKPDVQRRVQEELDRVVGTEGRVSLRHQTEMPFLEATILEILRFSILAPTSIPHATMEATNLFDWSIPKGAFVLPNLYQTTRDPDIWTKPNDFDPAANFLSPTGDTVINKDKLISFSIGRRSCIGESLARMEIFLYFSTLLQHYNVTCPEGENVCIDPTGGLFRMPSNYNFFFTRRN